MKWVRAIRPSSGATTSLLVVSGFRHSDLPVNWAVVITVCLLTCLAMVWNDYHDRDYDIAKGRVLANTNPIQFHRLALLFASVSLTMSGYVWWGKPSFGFLCFAMWVACMVYPFAQNNALSKNLIVSLTMAATVMFPIMDGVSVPRLWLMAALITIIVSIREHAKDVVDVEVDRGKKKTLALVLKNNPSKRVAVAVRMVANVLLVATMV